MLAVFTPTHATELILLTAGYWLVDLLIRRDGVLWPLQRLGISSPVAPAALVFLASLGLSWIWSWNAVPQGGTVRLLAVAMAALLSWRATTQDINPVTGDAHWFLRALLFATTVASAFNPAFLLTTILLLSTPFGTWQHHATLPMRLLQATVAYLVLMFALEPTGLFHDLVVFLFFLLVIQVSHYFITGLAKILLGPRWFSWVTDNKIHHLAASAYSWGWARFVPWPWWKRVISALKFVEKPAQLLAFSIELLAPLAFLHVHAAIAFSVLWAAFHLGVFLLSGLLFWEWIAVDLLIATTLFALPEAATSAAFGPASMLLAVAFMALFPLRHKLWKPMPLGWWDTPFTQRMHWVAHGISGKRYGVYNNFMCPHERLYGKVHGCFLAPTAVCTYHLGEVWKHDLRDALRDAGPDLTRLEAVRERFGIMPTDTQRADNHRSYLKSYFATLNRGARKHILPRPLRWLKAPGGQCYYWGELPAYRNQEPVRTVSLIYREEYFDGKALQRLRNECVEEVTIPDEPVDIEPTREPTPKEIDDFLLGFAAGRLIDLPGFSGGYVTGDDGKVPHQQ